MELNNIFQNRMLALSILSWFVAQVLKIFLTLIATKTLNLKLITQSGGMPSSHSSIICTLGICMGRHYGYSSPIFAFVTVVAMIVMYDAMGVRRATGEQARVLNKLIDMMSIGENLQIKLKEVLGHKPMEVLAGAILGILIGFLY